MLQSLMRCITLQSTALIQSEVKSGTGGRLAMRCMNNYHMRQPMTTLLIDADILAYHVSAANQHTYKFGDDAVEKNSPNI